MALRDSPRIAVGHGGLALRESPATSASLRRPVSARLRSGSRAVETTQLPNWKVSGTLTYRADREQGSPKEGVPRSVPEEGHLPCIAQRPKGFAEEIAVEVQKSLRSAAASIAKELRQDLCSQTVTLTALQDKILTEIGTLRSMLGPSKVVAEVQRLKEELDVSAVIAEIRSVKSEVDFSEVLAEIRSCKDVKDATQNVVKEVQAVDLSTDFAPVLSALQDVKQVIAMDVQKMRSEVQLGLSDLRSMRGEVDVSRILKALQEGNRSLREDVASVKNGIDFSSIQRSLHDHTQSIVDEVRAINVEVDLSHALDFLEQRTQTSRANIDFSPVLSALEACRTSMDFTVARNVQKIKSDAEAGNVSLIAEWRNSFQQFNQSLQTLEGVQKKSSEMNLSRTLDAIHHMGFEVDVSGVTKAIAENKADLHMLMDTVTTADGRVSDLLSEIGTLRREGSPPERVQRKRVEPARIQ